MQEAISRPAQDQPERSQFDSEYVRRLQEGDPETERHFAAYFGQLLRIKLRARLRNPQTIEDLTQETFLRVLSALKSNSVRSPERLGGYVNAVCNNLLLELFRQQSRHGDIELDEQFDPPDCRISAESEMVSEERRRLVRKVLDELPVKDRELLRMVFYQDLDSCAICKSFNVERGYLRVLVHRAKARFRECLMTHPVNGEARRKD